MGLLQLIPLLASLPIILLQGSPTDLPPPPPDIAVTPEKREYLIGDTVSIRCSAPRSRDKVRGFQFSRTGGWLDVRTAWRTYTYTFNVTGPKDGGSHTCTYTVGDRYRQARRSRESRAVDINVRDPPPQPTLVLNASAGVVSEGFPLLFLCTAPASAAEAAPPRFRFYKDGAEAIGGAEVATQGHQARLRVAESSRNHTGNFTCGYEEHIEGRWILSFLSEAVEVFVKEPPSAPRLGVEPPFTVLSEGSPLRLTCLAPGAGSRLRFRFYRNGVEIPEGSPGPKNLPGTTPGGSSELLVPQTPRGFGGTFSCGFEEDVGGTWVPSPGAKRWTSPSRTSRARRAFCWTPRRAK
ncbi:alpha-1B-glycoprotein [Anser cygnoides]|uniref:alpha-1B-glycoprotein n=1 Tax=Anser cygnoides TaxID=8845 RepID=UPI0034D2B2D5